MDLRAAAELAGCTVERRETGAGFDRALVVCPDGWAAARLLVERAEWEARAPTLDSVARELAHGPAELRARRIHAWVRRRLRFEPEKGERFMSARAMLAMGAVGDCDDHARVVYALARKCGLPARLAFLARQGASGPKHVWCEIACPEWRPVETTIAARFGEDPVRAALRLGALRKDLAVDSAFEVIRMTPAELREVAAQQTALHLLGFDPGPVDGVSGPRTRHAIKEFQEAHQPDSGPVDGVVGPKTIGALVVALQHAGIASIRGTDPVLVPVETRQWSGGDLALLKDFAERRQLDPVAITLVMLSESGLDPTRKNVRTLTLADGSKVQKVVAAGLIQWTRAGAPDAYKDRIADIAALPIAAQIGMMDRYYAPYTGRLQGPAAVVYLANFLPALVGHATGAADELVRQDGRGMLSRVLQNVHRVGRESAETQDRKAYLDNSGFDGGFGGKRPRKGAITLGDLELALDDARASSPRKFEEFVSRMGVDLPDPNPFAAGLAIAAGAGVTLLAAWLAERGDQWLL